MLRNQCNLTPISELVTGFDDNTRFEETVPIRRDQPSHTERMAASVLGLRGDSNQIGNLWPMVNLPIHKTTGRRG